tara:strand:- start:704 stop:1834 length:1131 start_codon:yes stop_codon:yes gene_type:complete
MTELIDVVQKQDPGSELVTLFELNFNGTTLYFHPGLDDNLDKLYFEDATGTPVIREYDPFPISMTGVEFNSDGATNRPSLTVANVTNFFSTSIEVTNEDLIGETIVVRQTLASELEDAGNYPGNGTAPIEFPKKKFIIDRVAAENSLSVTFELSSPYDLQGIKLPNRQVIGKYCPWIYQGMSLDSPTGGCNWPADLNTKPRKILDDNDEEFDHKPYFTAENNPLLPSTTSFTAWTNGSNATQHSLYSFDSKKWRANQGGSLVDPSTTRGEWTEVFTYTTWTDATSYNTGSGTQYVENSNTIWKLLITHTSATAKAPVANSKYWLRAEICGKMLSSCKCRFQFVPYDADDDYSHPKADLNSNVALPFGGFPGTSKFR